MRTILNNRISFWALLAIPAALILLSLMRGQAEMMDVVAPSGEWSARFMIAAMMIGPLADLLGSGPAMRWLIVRRRALGVAAFCYAAVHLIFYIIDMGAFQEVWNELPLPGIWTGWAALTLMLPLALSSNDAAMRKLKARWKKLQRLVYPAAVLTLFHWALVHNSAIESILYFTPLLLLHLTRITQFKLPKRAGA
jgi:methionine sulfoxide reductase heme-binding subunit